MAVAARSDRDGARRATQRRSGVVAHEDAAEQSMIRGPDDEQVGAESLGKQVKAAADPMLAGRDQLRIERRRIPLTFEQHLGPGSFGDDGQRTAAADQQVLAVDVRERDHAVGCGQLSRQRDRVAAAGTPIDTDQNSSEHRGSFAVVARR